MEFISNIEHWYNRSTNTQYLFIVSHGVLDEDGIAIGIGNGGDSDHYITWFDLWNCLVRSKKKPPNIVIMGCKVDAAVAAWNQVITNRINNPYYIAYTEIVSDFCQKSSIYRVIATLTSFLHTNFPITTLDREIEIIEKDYPGIHAFLPVKLPGRRAQYINTSIFESEIEMTVKDYLDYRSEYIRHI
jgi:hypothetical protein